MIKAFLLAFAIVAGYCAVSQAIIPRFESLGVNDGMPHSSVYSILQDKKGFMWFGTADGLCRYDGTILKTFKYSATHNQDAVNNFVRGKILEDKRGNIWYCNESGVYKWDFLKESVSRVRSFEKKEFNNAGFQSVYLDDTSLWMYNPVYGICEFNIISGAINLYPLPYPFNNSGFTQGYSNTDEEGNLWLNSGAKNAPYIIFNRQSGTCSVQLAKEPPQAIFFDNKRRILVYEDKLVYPAEQGRPARIVPKMIDGRKKSFYSSNGIRDNSGRWWMTAGTKGLVYYDEVNNLFRAFRHDNSKIKSLPFDLTTCLFIDRNENLWIGIDGAGVARLDLKQPKFNLFPLSEGDFPVLNDYFTKCFYQDTAGRIWFGTQTNGLNIFDPKQQMLTNYQSEKNEINSLPGNIVGSILKDRDGNTWIGSSGGFSLFNEKKRSFTTIPVKDLPPLNPGIQNLVYKMLQLENGDILAATTLGIIKIIKEKKGFYQGHYFKNDKWLISVTTDIAEMPDKTIYATLAGPGLYHFKPAGICYELVDRFLEGIDLRSLRKDEKKPGYLWISSGKGLIHFNTTTNAFKIWDEKDGMANSYVYGSLEDAAGNLWISTNKGLTFFNRQENKFDNYSYSDGLQSNEFNTQAFYKSSTGIFYFGGIRGFNWFTPGNVSKEHLKPVAAITQIEINDTVFHKDSAFLLHHTITVPYDENDFNFQFAALDFTRPEANKVQFNLEGWDHYQETTGDKSTRYANLPPGSYTLQVRVSNAEGIWSDEENVRIVIKPPFWQRNWFLAAVSLLFLLAIVFMTYRVSAQKAKRKLRLLEKQIAVNAERNRISADMHDEIGSGITHIALLSELIQTQHKDATALKNDISTIAASARKLVQTMGDIIWALNPHNDTLENLLAYTREQSQQYFEPLNIQFDICFPDLVPGIRLSNAERRNLYLVTREALNNAMKHSGATAICLKLAVNKRVCCFTVTDDGVGINENKVKPGSNGLSNMRKRMKDVGGTIEWVNLEKGTTVQYCLPF